MWDLSSQTRGWTWPTAVTAVSPNHWTTRELSILVLMLERSSLWYNSRFSNFYIPKKSIKAANVGISVVVQWDQGCLRSTRMQVWSLAWHSGLRIQHSRCSCSLACNCSSDLIPGPEAPYATGWLKKKMQQVLVFHKKILYHSSHCQSPVVSREYVYKGYLCSVSIHKTNI